jgi:hypothetical protein
MEFYCRMRQMKIKYKAAIVLLGGNIIERDYCESHSNRIVLTERRSNSINLISSRSEMEIDLYTLRGLFLCGL